MQAMPVVAAQRAAVALRMVKLVARQAVVDQQHGAFFQAPRQL